jgi:site-specific recombinase XerD
MNYLQDFLSFTQFVHGRSANTVNSYRWDLLSFLEWVKVTGLDVTTLRPVDIDDFFIWLRREKGNTAQSVNRKRSARDPFFDGKP